MPYRDNERKRERGGRIVSKQTSLIQMLLYITICTHHRAETQVIGLRVGHNTTAQRASRGEATLQSAGGAQCAHATSVPAAMHMRMCRMQTTGKVSMLRWNDKAETRSEKRVLVNLVGLFVMAGHNCV